MTISDFIDILCNKLYLNKSRIYNDAGLSYIISSDPSISYNEFTSHIRITAALWDISISISTHNWRPAVSSVSLIDILTKEYNANLQQAILHVAGENGLIKIFFYGTLSQFEKDLILIRLAHVFA